jgi:hypothetical protein
MFYTTGMEHSPTSATGTAWQRTPWRATQRAAWAAVRKADGGTSAATESPLNQSPSSPSREHGLYCVYDCSQIKRTPWHGVIHRTTLGLRRAPASRGCAVKAQGPERTHTSEKLVPSFERLEGSALNTLGSLTLIMLTW